MALQRTVAFHFPGGELRVEREDGRRPAPRVSTECLTPSDGAGTVISPMGNVVTVHSFARPVVAAASRSLAVIALVSGLWAAVPALDSGAAPLRSAGAPALVIYTDDVAYVRDPRRVSLGKGPNEIHLEGVPARLDSTSVRLEGPGLDVREQAFHFDLYSGDKVFRRFLGDSIFFRWQSRPARGVLEGIDGDDLFIRRRDSTDVLLMIKRGQIQEVEFPARRGGVNLSTRPSLRWRVVADAAGEKSVLLSYLTRSLGWTTEYTATLEPGEKTLSLSGWATISNRSGASYAGARVSLVAGEVHRAGGAPDRSLSELADRAEAEAPRPGALFAYHTYRVEEPLDLPAYGSIQVPVVRTARIQAARAYRYDGAKDGSKVRAEVVFTNDKGAGLGIPLPAGRVRVFGSPVSGDGAVALIGEDAIDHTPAGERVRLFCGVAFDLVGERTRVAHTRTARNVTEDQFSIRLRNAGGTEARVTVAETHYGAWEITQKSAEFRKKSAEVAEFDVTVPAGGEANLTYTVRTTF
jgi:hypothetical protein